MISSMNSNRARYAVCVVSGVVLLVCCGCGRNRTHNPQDMLGAGATGRYGSVFVLYDDELKTGGGVYLYPSGDNQSLDTDSRELPYAGARCIRYSWNGGAVCQSATGRAQHAFAGFSLAVSATADELPAAAARDFSDAGYTVMHVFVRGSLSDNTILKLEGPDDGDETTPAPSLEIASLSDSWQAYSFPVTPASLARVKEFFKATFVYSNPDGTLAAGGGGSVAVDTIYLER